MDYLIVAKDEALIEESDYAQGRQLPLRAIELVNGYIRFLQSQDASQARDIGKGNGKRNSAVLPKEGPQ